MVPCPPKSLPSVWRRAGFTFVPGMGIIRNRKTFDNAIIVTIGVPESLAKYMIPKGSVAVDGISLTINRCDRESFDVSIIPHTAKLTTVSFKKVGDSVNIETDMILLNNYFFFASDIGENLIKVHGYSLASRCRLRSDQIEVRDRDGGSA